MATTSRLRAKQSTESGNNGGQPWTELEALAELLLITLSGSVEATVTPNFPAVGASASGTIPAGVKGFTFTMIAGTGTFGGRNVSAGFSQSGNNVLASAISWTTAAASDAFIYYEV